MCGKDMVQYARPTIVAIIFLKLFQIVASNNVTKGNNINSILLADSSTHNLTQTSKIGLEGEYRYINYTIEKNEY